MAAAFAVKSRPPSRERPMPSVVSDIVDAYIFRRLHARIQFLLLLRRPDAPLGNTWQSIHEQVEPGETALEAAERALAAATGLSVVEAYSADFINQVYDHTRDAIVLAPVFAFAVAAGPLRLGPEFADHAWCEREEATSRLLWAGQRWAVRHIEEIIGFGGVDAEFYRIR
jgi:ADP-ribose pyrophosphatase YjhB (NUDIX family)